MPDSAVLSLNIPASDHEAYLRPALSLATKSPPKPTNYRVGAVLVNGATNEILSEGYTLELEGNTHAEQCCFEKLAARHGTAADRLADVLPAEVDLYTTMEPCTFRQSGNLPCADRILALKKNIRTVYVGVHEPDTFVSNNSAKQKLGDAGIAYVHVPGLEKQILAVATAGHQQAGAQ